MQLALGEAHSAVMTDRGRVYVFGGAAGARQCWPGVGPRAPSSVPLVLPWSVEHAGAAREVRAATSTATTAPSA